MRPSRQMVVAALIVSLLPDEQTSSHNSSSWSAGPQAWRQQCKWRSCSGTPADNRLTVRKLIMAMHTGISAHRVVRRLHRLRHQSRHGRNQLKTKWQSAPLWLLARHSHRQTGFPVQRTRLQRCPQAAHRTTAPMPPGHQGATAATTAAATAAAKVQDGRPAVAAQMRLTRRGWRLCKTRAAQQQRPAAPGRAPPSDMWLVSRAAQRNHLSS